MTSEARIGTTLAGYRIDARIGRGGMGVVYRATHLRLQRTVALKLLAEELADDETFRYRFERESRLAATLDHPHVIPIYDAGLAGGLLYLSMRFVDGSDLATLVKQAGRLDPQRACTILDQVAAALDAAHAIGLVHRDVKPGNILVDPNPDRPDHAYLSDFGLSRRLESTSITGGPLYGTFLYMAPEQFEGSLPRPASDQYALGCVAYKCLTGSAPFTPDSFAAIMGAHLNTPAPRISREWSLPPGVDAVLAKAIAKDPADRYATCQAFVTALRAEVERPHPVAARTAERDGRARLREEPPTLPTRPVRPPVQRPDRRPVIAAAAVLVLVLAAVTTFLLRRDGPSSPVGPPGSAARPAGSVQFVGSLSDVATGPDGRIYIVSGGENRVWRLEPSGVLTTVAGTGEPGFSGDGGPANQAQLSDPKDIAVGEDGTLYIADTGNDRIRTVDPTGVITTIAGTGSEGVSGDDLPAVRAQLTDPEDVDVDGEGTLYLTDTGNHRIRRVDANGIITTVAGNGTYGFSGDNLPAIQAQLAYPTSVAVDRAGNLYIADHNNARVRRVNPAGIITTLAGNGTDGYAGDGGPATQAQLSAPTGLAIDRAGNLYIADRYNHSVRTIDLDGTISTVAGTGVEGFSGDGGPARQAQLSDPAGVAIDRAGNLYIADNGNHRVRQVDPDGVIATLVGTGPFYPGDGGPAAQAQVSFPTGIATDRAGNVYISDYHHHRIRKIDLDGIITTIAGTGAPGISGDTRPATEAQLFGPTGVAVDRAGTLYIAQADSHRVRKVDTRGIITTVAGTGATGFSGDGGPADQAELSAPTDVAVDQRGTLYIADRDNHAIRKVDPAGVITTIAGTGVDGFAGDGGPATAAQLETPESVVPDAAGNLYISDRGNHRIRRIDPAGVITTIAGTGIPGADGDGGPATAAQLTTPEGITIDAVGNLYVAEYEGHRIRKIDTAGVITTVAGTGVDGFSGDGGPATDAELAYPTGVAVDEAGTLYIADSDNNRIRKVDTGGTITTIAGDTS